MLEIGSSYTKAAVADEQTIVNCLHGNKYTIRTLCKNQMDNIVLDGESVIIWEDVVGE